MQAPIGFDSTVERLALREPFRISGHCFVDVPVLRVTLRQGPHRGRGEAAGVYYLDDRPEAMPRQLEPLREALARGLTREALRGLLPPCGARHALDAALWELESRRRGVPVWQLAGLPAAPRPLLTTFTLGADAPEAMAGRARSGLCAAAPALKLKLTGDGPADVERVRAVRAARPDAWLAVDANQGYTPATIEPLLPVLAACRVSLLEQPFPRGHEAWMARTRFPSPTAADESCLDLAELGALVGLFDVVNIKLDKCGGLTEGLLMAREARRLGLQVMVGNMGGSSLAMAPAFVLGQLCDVVDLDGPTILATDPAPTVRYHQGRIDCPGTLWGAEAGAP